jgi:hypothetical protein
MTLSVKRLALLLSSCALPFGLPLLPMQARIASILALGALGPWLFLRKSDWGAWLPALAVASGWIALASYPLAPSKWPLPFLYAPLLAAMALPFLLRRTAPLFRLAVAALAVAVLLTPPGRRFAGGENDPGIRALAAAAAGPREAVALVHQRLERRAGPPTDTAADTLRRGYAHCGGINNVLHKVLLAQGVDSRIVHVERQNGKIFHTLVEATVEGVSFLADAQEDAWIPLRAEDLLRSADRTDLPLAWRGYESLYRYDVRRGYVRQ